MADISLVSFSEAKKIGRFDSEYFKPEFLKIDTFVSKNKSKFTTFSNLGLKVDASAFYPSLEPLYGKGDLPFLRVSDVDTLINYDDAVRIPESILKEYKTLNVVKAGDIVITKGGSIARIGLINKRAAVCRDLIFLNSAKLSPMDYKYLFFYLLTDFSNKLLIRSSSMTVQSHLTINLVREIPIFNTSPESKAELSKIYDVLYENYETSNQLYSQAEQLLIKELRLDILKPRYRKVYTAKLIETLQNNRFDAEYYTDNYDELINHIKSYVEGSDSLKNVIKIQDKNFIPKNGVLYPYIELSNIVGRGEIRDVTSYMGENLPSRARRKVQTGDLIISSIEGSLASCALIPEEYNNALCSTGFYILSSDKINAETLLVMFKSDIFQKLMKKGCSGTILTAIGRDELEKMVVPLIRKNTQERIAEKIKESHRLRKEAKELLYAAKKKVESFIGG